jgi:putative endonuclease
MQYFVYIIQSEKDNSYYKGFSENPINRLGQHNNGFSKYTSHKTPWKLVCILEFETKQLALIKEKKIKKYSVERLLSLIHSAQNILPTFF